MKQMGFAAAVALAACLARDPGAQPDLALRALARVLHQRLRVVCRQRAHRVVEHLLDRQDPEDDDHAAVGDHAELWEKVVRKLRLQITDYSNPTLNITSIQASAPARQLVFELKEPASQPLRLYFGNASVPAPHYDFETELQSKPSLEPAHSTFGDVTANPQYQPEPRPLTERVPWLIYIVLAISSIALAFILVSLARNAMRGSTQKGTKDTKLTPSI